MCASVLQCVIDHQALPAFRRLLQHSKNSIQKESAWTISNITAGNVDQIQAVLEAGLIPLVIKILETVSYPNVNSFCHGNLPR